MALVLRKTVIVKNVSLLKCIKGRTLASTINVKNPTALAKPANSSGKQNKNHFQKSDCLPKQLSTIAGCAPQSKCKRLGCSFSCPAIFNEATARRSPYLTLFSTLRTRALLDNQLKLFSQKTLSQNIIGNSIIAKRRFADCCLPPPSNCPAKCIQYMTGYYYYPYGFWFCGPYHVTGTCVPVGACPPSPCPKCCACLSPTLKPLDSHSIPSTYERRSPAQQPSTPNKSQVPRPKPYVPKTKFQKADQKHCMPTTNSPKGFDPLRRIISNHAVDTADVSNPCHTINRFNRKTGISKFYPAPESTPFGKGPNSVNTVTCSYSTRCGAKAFLINSKTKFHRQKLSSHPLPKRVARDCTYNMVNYEKASQNEANMYRPLVMKHRSARRRLEQDKFEPLGFVNTKSSTHKPQNEAHF